MSGEAFAQVALYMRGFQISQMVHVAAELLFPGAKERTPAEYGHLFRQSGLREPQIMPTRSAFSIIETGPAD